MIKLRRKVVILGYHRRERQMLYDVIDVSQMSRRSYHERIDLQHLQIMIRHAEDLLDRIEHLQDERDQKDIVRIMFVIVLASHLPVSCPLPAMASIIFIYRPFISMPEDLNCGT